MKPCQGSEQKPDEMTEPDQRMYQISYLGNGAEARYRGSKWHRIWTLVDLQVNNQPLWLFTSGIPGVNNLFWLVVFGE